MIGVIKLIIANNITRDANALSLPLCISLTNDHVTPQLLFVNSVCNLSRIRVHVVKYYSILKYVLCVLYVAGHRKLQTQPAGRCSICWQEVQGGPSASGKKYVDNRLEIAIGCKFILWPRPVTELLIWYFFPEADGPPCSYLQPR